MNITKQLGDRIVLNVWMDVKHDDPLWLGQLMLMDPQAGDVMLASFKGPTCENVEGSAGKYLRELGRQADGRATISSVIVRTDPVGGSSEDPLSGLDDLGSLGAASEYGTRQMDMLKIMVELEHETPRIMRVLQEHTVDREALGQLIDYATHQFTSQREDPVSRGWRLEREALNEEAKRLEDRRVASRARKQGRSR